MRLGVTLFAIAVLGLGLARGQELAPESVENMIVVYRADSGTLEAMATGGTPQAQILGAKGVRLGSGLAELGRFRWIKRSPDSGWLENVDADGRVLFRRNLTFDGFSSGVVWELTGRYGLVPENPSRDQGFFTLRPFSTADGVPLRNGSVRAPTSPGRPARLGFVIGGAGMKRVLVRAIGPSLLKFGEVAPARNLTLRVLKRGAVRATNKGWETGDSLGRQHVVQAFVAAGAFALEGGSGDCALVLNLEAGDFVAEAEAQVAGEVLIEFFVIE